LTISIVIAVALAGAVSGKAPIREGFGDERKGATVLNVSGLTVEFREMEQIR